MVSELRDFEKIYLDGLLS